MKSFNFASLLHNCSLDLQKEIKYIYNYQNNLKISNWNEIEISQEEFNLLKKIAEKKIKGLDVTFEMGFKYFRNNKIKIIKGVFVPQFDTEQIVDLVIEKKINNGDAIEIGSGTGAISIALSTETNLKIVSLDINPLATKLSNFNKVNNNVTFLNEDFFKYKPTKKFNLLISNPPYIPFDDKNVEKWVNINQPKNSIYSKNNGTIFYKYFFDNAHIFLKNKAHIIIEIGFNQSEEIKKMAEKISNKIEIRKDYSGNDRFIIIEYENEIIKKINDGFIIGHPTDTVFAIVGKLEKESIFKINQIKKREETQPVQILISDFNEIEKYLKDPVFVKEYIKLNNIDKTSLIVEVNDYFSQQFLIKEFNNTAMFRIPQGEILNLIKYTGPLFASSANLHNSNPLKNAKEVKKELLIEVEDIIQIDEKPSKIISLVNREVKKIRS